MRTFSLTSVTSIRLAWAAEAEDLHVLGGFGSRTGGGAVETRLVLLWVVGVEPGWPRSKQPTGQRSSIDALI